ncbi:MAG TPA: 50S ribosomal protein L35 [Dehalococcoidia bacterium]|nr:50S ribosomal protein L35 [Dehalococcoidia bacterium]
MAKKYKIKSHSGAKKRFGITGTGLYTRRKNRISHNRMKKTKDVLRDFDEMIVVDPSAKKRLKRLLPYL